MIGQSTFQRAESPEFTAQIERTVSGVWRATVTYKRGSRDTELFEFSDEDKMRAFLGSLSSRVKYFFSRQMPADFNPGQPRQYPTQQQQRAPEAQKSALEEIGFSRAEAENILWACYQAAMMQRESYLDCEQNRQTLMQYLEDCGLPVTSENLLKAIDDMSSANHLVRKSRKRGDPMVSDYIPKNQNVAIARDDSAAKNMTLDELRNIEHRRQAQAIRKRNLPPGFIA